MEKDPVRKRKFIFTIAQLYRDKENDQDRAVELFNGVPVICWAVAGMIPTRTKAVDVRSKRRD